MKKQLMCIVCILSMIFSSLLTGTSQVYAKTEETEVQGGIYTQGGKEKYTGGAYTASGESKIAHGMFKITANIAETNQTVWGMRYGTSSSSVKFSYGYYHDMDIHKDSCKKIGDLKLGTKAGKGVLVLETSKDGNIWQTKYVKTNLLKERPSVCNDFYIASDVELASGYYYRVTVAYTYEQSDVTRSVREQYQFYLYNSAITTADDNNAAKQTLGTKIRTEKNGYKGEKEIEDDDCHYGWDLGKFFISGYTTSMVDATGTPIFLKNQSDKLSLWFNLAQEIDKLNQKKSLSIVEDEGYDQYFETKKMDLGKGALIIRYTDYENVKHESKVYTNFLEENAILGKNQRIQFLGEGDYEVALDYEVENDKTNIFGLSVFPDYSYYRIYFKFSVRNADSNVRLYDVDDKTKLKTNDFTENGFKLNQTLSRYLDVEVKHEVYDAEKNSFTEDKNLMANAKDGGKYIDEGFYLITAKNRYTDSQTNRIVYVGKNKFLQKCAQSGMMPDEIVQYVKTELEKREEESRLAAEAAAKRKEERAAEESRSAEEASKAALEESKRQEESKKAAQESAKAAETTVEETVKSTSAAETTQAASTSLESSTEEQATSKNGNNPWNVIGILVGLVLIVLVIAGIAVLWRRHNIKKQKEAARNYDGPLMTNLSDDPNDIKNKFKHTGERKHGKDKDNK